MQPPSLLTTAREFALQAHGDQQYGERPYAFHLDMVAGNLVSYGELAQVIGYLHDVVEDTGMTKAEVESAFGPFVAECVGLLTDEPGADRKERKEKTCAKLAQVTGPARLALIVKTADRLANTRACVADNNEKLLAVYCHEQPAFKKAAYRAGLCDPLWDELDTLLALHPAPAAD